MKLVFAITYILISISTFSSVSYNQKEIRTCEKTKKTLKEIHDKKLNVKYKDETLKQLQNEYDKKLQQDMVFNTIKNIYNDFKQFEEDYREIIKAQQLITHVMQNKEELNKFINGLTNVQRFRIIHQIYKDDSVGSDYKGSIRDAIASGKNLCTSEKTVDSKDSQFSCSDIKSKFDEISKLIKLPAGSPTDNTIRETLEKYTGNLKIKSNGNSTRFTVQYSDAITGFIELIPKNLFKNVSSCISNQRNKHFAKTTQTNDKENPCYDLPHVKAFINAVYEYVDYEVKETTPPTPPDQKSLFLAKVEDLNGKIPALQIKDFDPKEIKTLINEKRNELTKNLFNKKSFDTYDKELIEKLNFLNENFSLKSVDDLMKFLKDYNEEQIANEREKINDDLEDIKKKIAKLKKQDEFKNLDNLNNYFLANFIDNGCHTKLPNEGNEEIVHSSTCRINPETNEPYIQHTVHIGEIINHLNKKDLTSLVLEGEPRQSQREKLAVLTEACKELNLKSKTLLAKSCTKLDSQYETSLQQTEYETYLEFHEGNYVNELGEVKKKKSTGHIIGTSAGIFAQEMANFGVQHMQRNMGLKGAKDYAMGLRYQEAYQEHLLSSGVYDNMYSGFIPAYCGYAPTMGSCGQGTTPFYNNGLNQWYNFQDYTSPTQMETVDFSNISS